MDLLLTSKGEWKGISKKKKKEDKLRGETMGSILCIYECLSNLLMYILWISDDIITRLHIDSIDLGS